MFQDGSNKDKKVLNSNDTLICRAPYSNDFSSIKNIVYKYLPVLNKDLRLRTILKASCKIVSRKNKTLETYCPPVNSQIIKHALGCFRCNFFLVKTADAVCENFPAKHLNLIVQVITKNTESNSSSIAVPPSWYIALPALAVIYGILVSPKES